MMGGEHHMEGKDRMMGGEHHMEGKDHMMGGKRHMRGHKCNATCKHNNHNVKKGGNIIADAVVPFGLMTFQKMWQRGKTRKSVGKTASRLRNDLDL